MGRRVLPVFLAIVAAILDGHGSHGLARDALLAAVPFAAVAALLSFGEYLEAREDAVLGLQALLCGAAATCSWSRAPRGRPRRPRTPCRPWGCSALVGCLAVFAVKASVAAVQHGRRLRSAPREALTDFGPPVSDPLTRPLLERERARCRLGDVDQRLDGEERADRNDEAESDADAQGDLPRG